jgi:hypothetical protein
MKKMIKISAGLAIISCFLFTGSSMAQSDHPGQSQSYVKIKTMKIVNGDTIVSEKEYTGNGDMQIQDSLMGQGFGDFRFGISDNTIDTSFMKNFTDMQEMFKNFNFNMMPEMPEFNGFMDIDSLTKEFNFQNFDVPSIGKNNIIIKSFKDTLFNNNESITGKSLPDADMHVYGKDDRGKPVTYSKKITILENGIGNNKINDSKSLQLDVFPNPANEFFNVSFQLDPKNKTNITMTDMNGKQLLKESIDKAEGTYTRQFDMKVYASGTYLINVKQGKKSVAKRIIIE